MGPGQVDDLMLERWGTRFSRPEHEDAYRRWHFQRSQPQHRAVLLVTLAFWAAVLGIEAAFGSLGAVTATAGAVIVGGSLLVSWLSLHRRDERSWRRAVGATGVNTALLSVLVVTNEPRLDPGMALVVTGTFGPLFIFGVSRDGLQVAAPGALICAVVVLCLRAMSCHVGEITGFQLAYDALVVFMSLLIGTVIALNTERASHGAYRQERVIEEQRATIARQQELLKKELSHQVAERSRELGAALAKSDVTLDVRALKEGERFAERYRVVSRLGAGGMGAVYEVERTTDGQRLALKAVVGEVSGASAARFAREAEIGARVHHPNLVSIVDVGVSSGVPYLVMELVRGGSLEAQRAKFGDVGWALPILKQIADGLAALHEAGVVHRDLKPANVLRTETGAKISDFGISRFGAIEDASVDANAATMAATPKKSAELTATNMVMGTPLYMAPEGAKTAKALDASADVFAFGILAYEMLTGRSPFAVPAFVLAMAEQPIPAPPAIDDPRVPPRLRSLVARALVGESTSRPRVREIVEAFASA